MQKRVKLDQAVGQKMREILVSCCKRQGLVAHQLRCKHFARRSALVRTAFWSWNIAAYYEIWEVTVVVQFEVVDVGFLQQ